MEVETSIIKDETVRSSGVRGISIAAGQHHTNRRGGHHHHKTTTAAPPPVSSNVATIAPPPGTTVTVRVGLNMNMCRLCLAEGTASTRLQPVFYTKDTPDEALLQRIAELTTIQVQYATDFPSSVCIGCRSKLEEYYHFRRQCIENDEILKIKYYEIKAAEDYHREQLHQQSLAQEQQQVEQQESAKGEEYIDDGDDITLAIDESAEVEEYQEETEEDEAQQQQQQQQVVEQQTIQYADGTVSTEYVEATPGDDVRTVSNSSQQQQIHIAGYSEAEGGTTTIQAAEGHEIYYTDGTDTYAIHTTTEGYVNAANYVPQGYDNQTEIECTTIEHLPEEEVYMDEGGSVGTIITPRGVHDRPYVCKHCKTSFKYEYNYERHMKNHAKVLYRCGKCSKTFTKQRKCQQHFLKAHSSQRYECDICFRTYSLPTRLENHVIEMHSENGVYKCDRCSETFTSYLDFKSHRNTHHVTVNGSNPPTTVIAQISDQPQTQEPPTSPQPTPSRTATSISTRSSVSDSCDFEVMIDETKIQKPSPTLPETASVAEKRPEQDLACLEEEPISRKQPKTTLNSSPSSVVPTTTIATPPSVVVKNTTSAAATVITNGIDKNSLHRQLLQQIEESEAISTGPKIYKCDSCVKTFVHLNNLKAHIYAEHDNDKPFKCKLCPISFKTKEILVMHMLEYLTARIVSKSTSRCRPPNLSCKQNKHKKKLF
ncbi:zinc finger protein 236-like isoform X2 [Culex pipiens pallens]|uniref:zinc finger protein 236-like isoform X2 n=1 Tax=Culex pipiens pallens TaxID=42434 RepID=UPI0022AAE5D9|nr:zinc finger protein 236-like isoform X2 [Culex pipiens pallens]